MLREFKEFAVKGNVIDMAVGIIIGAAFTTVIKSMVDDLMMPLLGLLTGGLDFADKFVVLRDGSVAGPYASLAQARDAGATVLSYGQFINAAVAFLLVALALFFVVRWINRLRRPDTPPAPATKSCPYCMQIVHEDASRCAHCTSQLATDAVAPTPG
jgi:large conductance mechanosensitive channel